MCKTGKETPRAELLEAWLVLTIGYGGFQLTLAALGLETYWEFGNYVREFAVSLLLEPIKLRTFKWKPWVWSRSSIRNLRTSLLSLKFIRMKWLADYCTNFVVVWSFWLFVFVKNKLTPVSKCRSRRKWRAGGSWFPQHFDNVMTQFIINKRADA